jgi:diaminopropionate ammonia-lyase
MANNVTAEREAAIEALGARVVRSDENHDETGRDLKRQAHAAGWAIISEGANATEPQIAYDTIIGYGALFLEAASQLGRDIPTHVFVQTGVGGFAAAAAAMLRQKWPEDLPQLITVEADNADCVLRSVETGERVSVLGSLDTIMAGLAAGEVSDHAWAVLKHGANACMAIPDDAAVSTMRLLAGGAYGDPPISAGESGVAGLAGAIVALSDDGIRDQLGLDDQSRILTIGTEGVTDASIYRELVG